jgi:hypothetical protein
MINIASENFGVKYLVRKSEKRRIQFIVKNIKKREEKKCEIENSQSSWN